LGFGGEEGGELDVAGFDAEEGGVFTGAAALHGGADHDGGERELNAGINGSEEHGLGAAAAGAGDRDAVGIDFRQAQQEVQGANRVPRLQAHRALQMRLGLGTEQAPVLGRVHLGPLMGESVDQFHRELPGIRVSQHVPLPDHAAHARKLDAHRLKAALASFLESLLPFGNLVPELGGSRKGEARVGPMPVGEQDPGNFAGDVFRTIQVACHEEARRALEIDLLDREVTAIDSPMDDRMERRAGRHRPQSLGDQDLMPHPLCALLPLGLGRRRLEGKVAVQVFEGLQPEVIGLPAFGQDPRGRSGHGGGRKEGYSEGQAHRRTSDCHGQRI
jgi:hypothetical protein